MNANYQTEMNTILPPFCLGASQVAILVGWYLMGAICVHWLYNVLLLHDILANIITSSKKGAIKDEQ